MRSVEGGFKSASYAVRIDLLGWNRRLNLEVIKYALVWTERIPVDDISHDTDEMVSNVIDHCKSVSIYRKLASVLRLHFKNSQSLILYYFLIALNA